MAGKSVKTEQTGNRQVNDLQAAQSQATQQLRDGPFGQGNLVKGITFQGGDQQTVNHGLGRAYQGWVVVRSVYTGSSTGLPLEELPGVHGVAGTVDYTKGIQLYCGDGPNSFDVWFF